MSEKTTDGELLPSASWLSTAGCFHPAGPADSLWDLGGGRDPTRRQPGTCPSAPPHPPQPRLDPGCSGSEAQVPLDPADFQAPGFIQDSLQCWEAPAPRRLHAGCRAVTVSSLRCRVLWRGLSLSPRVSACFTAPAAARSGALTMCRALRYVGPTPPFLLQPRVCTGAGERAGVRGRPGAH